MRKQHDSQKQPRQGKVVEGNCTQTQIHTDTHTHSYTHTDALSYSHNIFRCWLFRKAENDKKSKGKTSLSLSVAVAVAAAQTFAQVQW